MRKNSNIIRAFDALTIVKGINSLGGPDKQVYYIESDVYAPDRRITPLLLQPYVNVSDPNGIITAGDKVSELVDGAWYVDAIDPKNSVTKSSAGSTLDDPFTIGDNHRLMVRLNTDKSVMLFFEGDYYDSRKGSKIHISLSYMLSTTHNSQNKPAPKVLLSKGASYTYNPLDDLTELIIESQLADDGKLLRGAVEWCEVEGTKITAISDAMPYYISGQHSDKLKINPSLMGDVVIRARNVSEEIYNKAYGVNPEWDNRMKEVFENRNLLVSPIWMMGGINVDGSDNIVVSRANKTDYIPIATGSYTCNLYDNWGDGWGVNFYKDKTSQEITRPQLWMYRQEGKFTIDENTKYIRLSKLSSNLNDKVKLERGDKSTPYTPAPEDLNFRNLVVNGDFRNGSKEWWPFNSQIRINEDGLEVVQADKAWFSAGNNTIVKSSQNESIFIMFKIKSGSENIKRVRVMTISDQNITGNVELKTDVVTTISGIAGTNILPFTNCRIEFEATDISSKNVATILSAFAINLTQTFGKGNEPTKEQLDEVFKDMPYIPSPYDYAPDGIVKGTYQSDMKFTPLYPNIEANVVFLTTPVIKKGVERIKAQAVLSTNKKTITNPEKHFDLKWILKPTTAGGSETVVGTGEFVDIPVANLPSGRVIGLDLDYNFKKQ